MHEIIKPTATVKYIHPTRRHVMSDKSKHVLSRKIIQVESN